MNLYLAVLARVFMPPAGLEATPSEQLLGAAVALLVVSVAVNVVLARRR